MKETTERFILMLKVHCTTRKSLEPILFHLFLVSREHRISERPPRRVEKRFVKNCQRIYK
jgi:hypothetical protein